MTEAEWLAYADPDPFRRVNHPMLVFLESIGRASERKSRLFAVACCRLLLSKVRMHPWYEHGVDVAERYADGAASASHLQGAYGSAPADWVMRLATEPGGSPPVAISEWRQGPKTAMHACWNAAELECGAVVADCAATNAAWAAVVPGTVMPDDNGVSASRVAAEQAIQCDLIRCIFGNPFCPLTADSAWLTPTVSSIAATAYEERYLPSGHLDPARLPVLADALEDAGCADSELLGHLRSPGRHVRGCWALDLILGKQ